MYRKIVATCFCVSGPTQFHWDLTCIFRPPLPTSPADVHANLPTMHVHIHIHVCIRTRIQNHVHIHVHTDILHWGLSGPKLAKVGAMLALCCFHVGSTLVHAGLCWADLANVRSKVAQVGSCSLKDGLHRLAKGLRMGSNMFFFPITEKPQLPQIVTKHRKNTHSMRFWKDSTSTKMINFGSLSLFSRRLWPWTKALKLQDTKAPRPEMLIMAPTSIPNGPILGQRWLKKGSRCAQDSSRRVQEAFLKPRNPLGFWRCQKWPPNAYRSIPKWPKTLVRLIDNHKTLKDVHEVHFHSMVYLAHLLYQPGPCLLWS